MSSEKWRKKVSSPIRRRKKSSPEESCDSLKFEVQTSCNGVELVLPVIMSKKSAKSRRLRGRFALITEVNVKILGFNRPVMTDCKFQAAAARPAGISAAT